MRKRVHFAAGLLAALALGAAPARAWNWAGHRVIARIAWEAMSETARQRAVEILMAAPDDSDLLTLLPADERPADERYAELFDHAAYWADIVRNRDVEARWKKYHHSDWHYVNYFWESTPDGGGRELTDRPPSGRLVERLGALGARLGDSGRPADERALDLAWVLHLMGDIHQPLHSTARVTASLPDGDRGGNEFPLDGDTDLHGYWDGALSRGYHHWFWLSDEGYVQRIARQIAARHPAPATSGETLDPESWARESVEIAIGSLYPESLVPGRRPPSAYRRETLRIAEARVALAGYRLAALLDAALGEKP